jgi:hypothetical protein
MKRPPAEVPGGINYHALEGGGWNPTADPPSEKRPKGTSIVTRIIIAIIAIALVGSGRCRVCGADAELPPRTAADSSVLPCSVRVLRRAI